MLTRFAMSPTIFSEDFGGARYRLKYLHKTITDQMIRHGQLVCRNKAEQRYLKSQIEGLGISSLRNAWDFVVDRAYIVDRDAPKTLMTPSYWPSAIRTLEEVREWAGYLDLFLADEPTCDRCGLDPGEAELLDPAGIVVARYMCVVPEIVASLDRLNNRYYRRGGLDFQQLWTVYLHPLVARAEQIVLVDKFASSQGFHPSVADHTHIEKAADLWDRIASTPLPTSGRRELRILTPSPRFEEVRERVQAFLESYCYPASGISDATILWCAPRSWKHHDRNFRFDTRTLEISSGIEYVIDPGGRDARITYRCAGDWQSEDYHNIVKEEEKIGGPGYIR